MARNYLKAEVVTKPLTSGILFSSFPTYVLKASLVANSLVSGIFLSTSIFIHQSLVVLCWCMWVKVDSLGIFFKRIYF